MIIPSLEPQKQILFGGTMEMINSMERKKVIVFFLDRVTMKSEVEVETMPFRAMLEMTFFMAMKEEIILMVGQVMIKFMVMPEMTSLFWDLMGMI